MNPIKMLNWLFSAVLVGNERPPPSSHRINGHGRNKSQRDRKAGRAKARHKGRMARLSRQKNRHG